MAQYIAKEIKCATINTSVPDATGLAITNQYCAFGRVDSGNKFKSFCQYDLGNLKDVEIESAYLYLFINGRGYYGRNVSLYVVTNTWNEETINGSNLPSNSSDVISGAVSSDNDWTKIDVKTFVEQWVNFETLNHGIAFVGDYSLNGQHTYFRNHHYTEDPSLTSYIEINYRGNQLYKISESRLRGIADEVRRITGTTESLTVDEMVTKLAEHEDVPVENLDEEIVAQDGLIETIQAALIGKGISASGDAGDYISGKIVDLDNRTAESVKPYCFYYDSKLNSVKLSNSKSIGQFAFYSCSNLTSVELASDETILEQAFASCGKLKTVRALNLKTIGKGVFLKSGVEELYMPELVSMSDRNQFGETKLKHVYLPKLTDTGNASFYGCPQLESIDMPSLINIWNSAFISSSALKNVNLPVLNYIDTEGMRASGIEDINGGNVHMPLLYDIGQRAFYGCTSLKTVYFPNVTNVRQDAFNSCTALERVDFGAKTNLHWAPFCACSALTTVIFRGSELSVMHNNNTFVGTPIESGTGYIYVPRDLVDSYKTATNFSAFADQIRAIEDYPDIVG